jgi:hypothetical protein
MAAACIELSWKSVMSLPMSVGAMSSNFGIASPPVMRGSPHPQRAVSGDYRLRARLRPGGRARRALSAALTVAGLLSGAGAAGAFEGKCLLAVDGTRYLDGPCNIEMSADGSFSIGAGETTRSKYFAFVNIAPGASEAMGFWNGQEAADHAHTDLGALTRDGACWVNSTARVCAWRRN